MPKLEHNKRYEFLDFTRGVAILLMFIYHLSFGLAQLGLVKINFSTELFWVSFRTLIVFLFLSLVGIGLYLASSNSLKIKPYLKRLLLLTLYFSLITLLSKIVRPNYYVFFGILHLIFVCSILGLLFIRFYWFNLIFGLSLFLLGKVLTFSILNHPWLIWIGMSETKPITDDFAPLIPWFGFLLIGIFLGKYFFEKNEFSSLNTWHTSAWYTALISWMGRHSIHLYFIHFQLFYVLVFFFG